MSRTKLQSGMTNRVLKEFLKATIKYPGLLVGVAIVTIAANLADLATPWIYKSLVDIFSQKQNTAAIGLATSTLIILLCVRFITHICGRLTGSILSRLEPRAMNDLTNESFAYLLGHSRKFFSDTFTGSLVKKINRYSRSYERVIDEVFFTLLPTAVAMIGTAVALYIKRPTFFSIFIIWLIMVYAINYYLSRWKLPLDLKRAEIDSRVGGALADAITNTPAITTHASQKYEIREMRILLNEWLDIFLRSWSRMDITNIVQTILMFIIEVILLVVSFFEWKSGRFTVGDFIFIQAYLQIIFGHTWNIGRVMRGMYESLADASEMVELLDLPHEVMDIPGAQPLKISSGTITFSKITFNYNETRAVFRKFSLDIGAREKVAFVGPSGSGKSTLVSLLLRLHDLTAGTINIDGQNIARVTQESLRKAIAYVPQDSILFHRSLMENIRYGRLDANNKEVIDAAKRAQIHDFIISLDDGYETRVGERGIKLSGGERQRVAIARAILKNAPILILDEATSSLDSESEHLIQKALTELMKGKTTIAIAHRLSTIMQMDKIVVLNEGRIEDVGTHQELLARKGTYARLWGLQAGGFLK